MQSALEQLSPFCAAILVFGGLSIFVTIYGLGRCCMRHLENKCDGPRDLIRYLWRQRGIRTWVYVVIGAYVATVSATTMCCGVLSGLTLFFGVLLPSAPGIIFVCLPIFASGPRDCFGNWN
jgi:hypothetical protein